MSDRLAALLLDAYNAAQGKTAAELTADMAARLEAKGVRVGDDGLDVERLRERLHAEVERLTNGATRPESRQMQQRLLRAVDAALHAALAATPAPTLDRERTAVRLLALLWDATGKDPSLPVRDLFDPNDPIVEDMEAIISDA